MPVAYDRMDSLRSGYQYRSDLDGLRALSVISVILYHFGASWLPGGFTGVDIFFVLSGYLINLIIWRDLLRGDFSLTNFYFRRMCRVLPALLVVILVTLLVAAFFLMPADYVSLGWQALTACFGLSGFYFLNGADYFASSAGFSPLLHTWSLGVEEQFYVLWPIAIWALVGWRGGLKGSVQAARNVVVYFLVFVMISSFLCSLFLIGRGGLTAFYLLPARAWEIALGALVVFLPVARSKWLSEVSSFAGLSLIVVGFFLISSVDSVPAWGVLPSCLGAALIVWPKTHTSFVAKILSLRPLVAIGLISYSLYLWHWPLRVFFRYYAQWAPPNFLEMLLLGLSLTILSYLSWRYVENRFRVRAKHLGSSRISRLAIGVMLMMVVGTGAVVVAGEGLPGRLSETARFYSQHSGPRAYHDFPEVCSLRPHESSPACGLDVVGVERPRVLLVGDSMADHLISAFHKSYGHWRLVTATTFGCRPLLVGEIGDNRHCRVFFRDVLERLVREQKFDAILLSASWDESELPSLLKTAEALTMWSERVLVLGPTISYRIRVPEYLASASLIRRPYRLEEVSSAYSSLHRVDEKAKALFSASRVKYHSVLDIVCPEGRCLLTTPENIPLMFDNVHYTEAGGDYVLFSLRSTGFEKDLGLGSD